MNKFSHIVLADVGEGESVPTHEELLRDNIWIRGAYMNDLAKMVKEFGWEEIESKNELMMSFQRDNTRMNVYFTTRTVTFQPMGETKNFTKPVVHKEVTDEEFVRLIK